jgi:hypothetical protein
VDGNPQNITARVIGLIDRHHCRSHTVARQPRNRTGFPHAVTGPLYGLIGATECYAGDTARR